MRIRFRLESWGRYVLFQLLEIGNLQENCKNAWMDLQTGITLDTDSEEGGLLISGPGSHLRLSGENKYGYMYLEGLDSYCVGELAMFSADSQEEAETLSKEIWDALRRWVDAMEWEGEELVFEPKSGELAL